MIDFADLEAVDICPRRDNLSRLRLLPDTHYVKSPYSIHNFSCLFTYLQFRLIAYIFSCLFTFFCKTVKFPKILGLNVEFCHSVYPWGRRQQVIGTPFFLKNSDADAVEEEANKTTSTMPSRRRTQRASRKSTKAERKSEVNSTLKETNIRRLLMSCGHFKRQCAFKLVTIGLATQNWRKSADNQNKLWV